MKNEWDSQFLLRVFDKIRRHGAPHQGSWMLEAVKGYTDFDGYTLFIEDANVQIQVGFHNQYHLNYESAEHKTQFEKKLKHIDKTY